MKKALICLLLSFTLILSATAVVFANDFEDPHSVKPIVVDKK